MKKSLIFTSLALVCLLGAALSIGLHAPALGCALAILTVLLGTIAPWFVDMSFLVRERAKEPDECVRPIDRHEYHHHDHQHVHIREMVEAKEFARELPDGSVARLTHVRRWH